MGKGDELQYIVRTAYVTILILANLHLTKITWNSSNRSVVHR